MKRVTYSAGRKMEESSGSSLAIWDRSEGRISESTYTINGTPFLSRRPVHCGCWWCEGVRIKCM